MMHHHECGINWGRSRFLAEEWEISFIYFVEISSRTSADFSAISSSCVIVRGPAVSMFGDQQMETLADIIQTALMLRVNKRSVG